MDTTPTGTDEIGKFEEVRTYGYSDVISSGHRLISARVPGKRFTSQITRHLDSLVVGESCV